MTSLLHPILLAIPVLVWFLYSRIRWLRFEQYKHVPRAPTSLMWGHLKVIGESMRTMEKGAHSDYAFASLHKQLGSPGAFIVDLRPFMYVICVIFSHSVAEQLSRSSKLFRYSVPKSPTMHELDPAIGKTSILGVEGEDWKSLRRRFNPGFAPHHLITLLPQIISKTRIFLSHLDHLAQSGEVFMLDELCVNLTFDIIGIVVLDVDFNAQDPNDIAKSSLGSIILHEFRGMLSFYDDDNPYARYNLFQRRRRRLQGERIDTSIRQVVRQKFVEMKESQKTSGTVTKGKSVLLLSLQDLDHLTPEIETQTADQVKTFLLAGHDTTAILLQWALYMLSIHPPILAKLKDELDAVLGPEHGPSAADPAAVLLERGDAVLSKLTYLSAVVKEILRLYPPAGSARMAAPGSGCVVRLDDGSDLCVDGMVLYLCHYGIHRDTKIFGADADAFRPERWLGDVDTSMNTNDDDAAAAEKSGEKKIPASSWRPFERGPRNCIGQELANLEARVILACTVRRYAFEKVGAGQRFVDGKLVGEELINKRQITAKPIDGMQMKVRRG